MKTLRCDAWRDFFNFVSFSMGRYDTHYLWRGQRNEIWELTSSLSRVQCSECGHLRRFLQAIAGLTQEDFNIEDSEEDRSRLWALGQHFGLKTPLIDFTQFPFVALFFAFVERDNPDQEEARAVFALDWHNVRGVNFHITETDGVKPFREQIEAGICDDELKDSLLQDYGHREDLRSMIETRKITLEVRERLCEIKYTRPRERQLHMRVSYSGENTRIHRCQ